jgi:hypothetical protein
VFRSLPTDIHLPLAHWAMPFTFLEVGVFCREKIKRFLFNKGEIKYAISNSPN